MKWLIGFKSAKSSNRDNQTDSNGAKVNSCSGNAVVDKLDSNKTLLSLPESILIRILKCLDTKSLLSLCSVSRPMYRIVIRYLYEDVVLTSKESLLKFDAIIHANFSTHRNLYSCRKGNRDDLRYFVKRIEFMDPQCNDSHFKFKESNVTAPTVEINGALSYTKPFGNPLTPMPSRKSFSTHVSDVQKERHSKGGMAHEGHSPLRVFFDFGSSNISDLEAKYVHYTYIELMIDILDYLPNLTHISMSEVRANFRIPLYYSILNDGTNEYNRKLSKEPKSLTPEDLQTFKISKKWLAEYREKFNSLPRYKSLEIRAASNSRSAVYLRPNWLCLFGVCKELVLVNVTIDTQSLHAPLEYLPLYTKVGDHGFIIVNSPVETLILNSCTIVPGNGIMKLLHSYFGRVRRLSLLNLESQHDLLLSKCLPLLTHLTIDFNSQCFTNQQLVDGSYYFPSEEWTGLHINDENSLSETLIDSSTRKTFLTPPPSTPVIIAINSGAIIQNDMEYSKRGALITKDQKEYFTYFRIHKFYYFYHYFKNIWDRICCQNIDLKIINIPFTNVRPLEPCQFWKQFIRYQCDDQVTVCGNIPTSDPLMAGENEQYSWDAKLQESYRNALRILDEPQHTYTSSATEDTGNHLVPDASVLNNFLNYHMFKDIPNINLWFFMKSLVKFKSVEFNMLRSWSLCTPRTRFDWELLLKPVLEGQIPVRVKDNVGVNLYSYGFKPTIISSVTE
ncbi:putative SCF ubiquitin ligase complex subunit SKP2 Ecym_2036 [Eremothecium cymbalariae DBVPG|uniref:F-box domain-containing protein n=1 Tax=Eremothecium cymbalariae (strain CBS 270.75 / DBVPG 7215 / KCTC 17166 / NRRL Y-17582) TaxID=931890 RepID=G8JNZ4_ERECY|nr:Hypothetical protein Ecym_2036 [Eremothecium cymbalariae DBVPG\